MDIVQDVPSDVAESAISHAIYRKMMRRIVPFIFVAYIVSQLDRFNISFAKLRFMHDLGLTDVSYGVGAGIFFIGYVIFEVPSNLYLQKVGARATFVRILILWGFVSSAMSFVRTPAELYLARFVLGAAEAGFVPGIILYLTYWFPASYRGRAAAPFYMAIPFAGILGGPLSGWILSSFDGIANLRDWQWLFIIEGLPAILLGVFAYFFLEDRPDDANWLTATEKSIVREDLLADNRNKPVVTDHGLKHALQEPKVYIAAIVFFSIIAGNNAIILWLPTTIRGFGIHNPFLIGVLSSMPYVLSVIAMYVISRHSDVHQERRWHVAVPIIVAASSFVGLGYCLSRPIEGILFLAIAEAGILSALCLFWTIPSAYLSGASAAGGIAMVSSLGMLGGFFSPIILGWTKSISGNLQIGFFVMAGIMVFGALILLIGIPESAVGSFRRLDGANVSVKR